MADPLPRRLLEVDELHVQSMYPHSSLVTSQTMAPSSSLDELRSLEVTEWPVLCRRRHEGIRSENRQTMKEGAALMRDALGKKIRGNDLRYIVRHVEDIYRPTLFRIVLQAPFYRQIKYMRSARMRRKRASGQG